MGRSFLVFLLLLLLLWLCRLNWKGRAHIKRKMGSINLIQRAPQVQRPSQPNPSPQLVRPHSFQCLGSDLTPTSTGLIGVNANFGDFASSCSCITSVLEYCSTVAAHPLAPALLDAVRWDGVDWDTQHSRHRLRAGRRIRWKGPLSTTRSWRESSLGRSERSSWPWRRHRTASSSSSRWVLRQRETGVAGAVAASRKVRSLAGRRAAGDEICTAVLPES